MYICYYSSSLVSNPKTGFNLSTCTYDIILADSLASIWGLQFTGSEWLHREISYALDLLAGLPTPCKGEWHVKARLYSVCGHNGAQDLRYIYPTHWPLHTIIISKSILQFCVNFENFLTYLFSIICLCPFSLPYFVLINFCWNVYVLIFYIKQHIIFFNYYSLYYNFKILIFFTNKFIYLLRFYFLYKFFFIISWNACLFY